jgi:hypothetical protein
VPDTEETARLAFSMLTALVRRHGAPLVVLDAELQGSLGETPGDRHAARRGRVPSHAGNAGGKEEGVSEAAQEELEKLPGMREDELRKHAKCSVCKRAIGHTGLPLF